VRDRAIAALRARAARQLHGDPARVEALAKDLADTWASLVESEETVLRPWSKYDRDKRGLGRPILSAPDDQPIDDRERKLVAPTSMRDTEPSVHLWLRFALGRKVT
jgi:hypothetical protein